MREMKESGIKWVGEIPSHWEVHLLMKILWLRARLGWKGLKSEEYVDDGYPFLSAYNIINQKLSWHDLNHITKDRYDESPEIKLSVGDILLVKDGGIGKCARVDSLPHGEATVNSSLAVVTPSSRLNYIFLYYFFMSNVFQNTIQLMKNGMGLPHLTQENMRDIKVPVPPLSEQKTIAEFLDKKCGEIDELVGIEEHIIAELQAYKQAIITEAVTKGLDYKQNKNKNWTICGYKNIFSNIPSNSYQILQSEINATGKYPVVSQSAKYIEGYSDATCVLIHKNPYIIFGDHTKVVKYIDFDFIIGADGVKVIVPKINEKFAYYLLLHSVTLIEDRGYARHFSVLATHKFLIPPLSEQQTIAEYLDGRCKEIDSLIAVKRQKIAELKEYKKSVIYEYVTGKKEII